MGADANLFSLLVFFLILTLELFNDFTSNSLTLHNYYFCIFFEYFLLFKQKVHVYNMGFESLIGQRTNICQRTISKTFDFFSKHKVQKRFCGIRKISYQESLRLSNILLSFRLRRHKIVVFLCFVQLLFNQLDSKLVWCLLDGKKSFWIA